MSRETKTNVCVCGVCVCVCVCGRTTHDQGEGGIDCFSLVIELECDHGGPCSQWSELKGSISCGCLACVVNDRHCVGDKDSRV